MSVDKKLDLLAPSCFERQERLQSNRIRRKGKMQRLSVKSFFALANCLSSSPLFIINSLSNFLITSAGHLTSRLRPLIESKVSQAVIGQTAVFLDKKSFKGTNRKWHVLLLLLFKSSSYIQDGITVYGERIRYAFPFMWLLSIAITHVHPLGDCMLIAASRR